MTRMKKKMKPKNCPTMQPTMWKQECDEPWHELVRRG